MVNSPLQHKKKKTIEREKNEEPKVKLTAEALKNNSKLYCLT
jgi:hypothetical protein